MLLGHCVLKHSNNKVTGSTNLISFESETATEVAVFVVACRVRILLIPVSIRVGFAFNEILSRLNEIKRAAGDDVVFAERHLVACEGPHFQRFYGKAGTPGDIGEPDVDFATRG
ncbi:hypothetical protein CKO_02293 [Citrobacter koseri ATCC BAA-895]|uniref:Uncharacterized protein n=1 Tax=Citrobacter koseri (strain ATCC BAA-895 / CDC 4225-83 / SGSC4696) TaxID=290338 RepID=A8AIV1_CITK8|nr:hypothetical protein CKO_02293 [Citrobacter koseri ATCC BAA-895]